MTPEMMNAFLNTPFVRSVTQAAIIGTLCYAAISMSIGKVEDRAQERYNISSRARAEMRVDLVKGFGDLRTQIAHDCRGI